MTIIKTCCCWVPLKKGSLICGAYTLVLYSIMVAVGTIQVDTRGSPASNDTGIIYSFNHLTETPIPMTVTVVICSGLTVMASVTLLVGLYLENRLMLLPWIFIVFVTTFVDFIYTLYMLGTAVVHPTFALVVTVDFFICFSNIYCLLCVVSLYQEYKAGRMWAGDYFQNPSQNGVGGPAEKRSVTFIENDHVSKVPLPMQIRRSISSNKDCVFSGKQNGVKNGGGSEIVLPTGRHLGGTINRISASPSNERAMNSDLLYQENNLGVELGLWTESKCCNGTLTSSTTSRDRRRSSARHVQFQPTIEEAESSSDGVQVTQLKYVPGDETLTTTEVTSQPSNANIELSKEDEKSIANPTPSTKLPFFLLTNDTSHLLERDTTQTNL